MKDFLEKIPIATLVASYFFICGGLYLIGFWSTFGIDITSFVSLTDIPKSFVFPFMIAAGVFILLQMAFLSSYPISIEKDFESSGTKMKEPKLSFGRRMFKYFTSRRFLLITSIMLMIYLYPNYKNNTYYWMIGGATGALMSSQFSEASFVKQLIPYGTIRGYFSTFIILIPLCCLGVGKLLSLDTYNNENILVLENYEPKSDTLKFVGFIGDKVVVSSLDNRRMIFINQSAIKEVRLVKIDKKN